MAVPHRFRQVMVAGSVNAAIGIFEAAFVDRSTVAWPGEVDIAPETLIWNGPEPDEPGVRPKHRLRVRPVTYEHTSRLSP